MPDIDLLAYAREVGAQGTDLYALLGCDATSTDSDVRRAFRRRALTAHPDKAGDAYDPKLYESLERARDVLLNAEARAAYTEAMRAVLRQKEERERMSAKRRRLVEDLERREREWEEEKKRQAGVQEPQRTDPVMEELIARGKAKAMERQRLMEEAEKREQAALAAQRKAKKEAEGEKSRSSEEPAMRMDEEDEEMMDSGSAGYDKTDGDRFLSEAEYDRRIADLERRLAEKKKAKEEKAQRKAEKKARKEAEKAEKEVEKKEPSVTAKVDDVDDQPPSHPSHQPRAPTTSTAASNNGGKPKLSERYSHIYERLRAAQAKKDEEMRRKSVN
ncbi:hypothetical protein VTJ04DRAFT_295 [Mycothermus thermophilus]|uniref:uncharacterized protein n=1 Tax=Humicola insolens TaxID=85995 RepID=UPI003742DBDB